MLLEDGVASQKHLVAYIRRYNRGGGCRCLGANANSTSGSMSQTPKCPFTTVIKMAHRLALPVPGGSLSPRRAGGDLRALR